MADNKQVRKARKRKDAQEGQPDKKDEATKEEYAIAKWMRKNVPIKKTKFLNHTVEYFTANKAIDQLMDSPWAKPKKDGEEAKITTRESVVEILEGMLRHKFYHRARKIVVPESELKSKKKKDKDQKEKDEDSEKDKDKGKEVEKEKEEKVEKVKGKKKKDKDEVTAAESSQAEPETEGEKLNEVDSNSKGDGDGDGTGDKNDKRKKKQGEEKKRRKIRLDMHLEQRFVDGTDAYVWIYEPTPYYNYIFGFLVVVAVIGVCLFPLWPSSVRQGVYYLSLAAAGFLVFILALAVIRMVLFGLIWAVTFGRHHFWFLPNLTEDVGFLASFWPLYKYEYKPGEEAEKKRKKSDSKTDDDENEDGKELLGNEESEGNSGAQAAESETESEGSQPSQTGKDFEMVDREEIES